MSPPEASADGDPTNPNRQEMKQGKNPNDVVSLGEALAGVNLGQGAANSNPNSLGLNAGAAAPFSLAPGPSPSDKGTWGNFADAAQAAFPASSAPHTPSMHSTPRGLEGAHNHMAAQMPNSDGLELFLSQSPSRTLGDDVFKLSHPNLPAMKEDERPTQKEASSAFRYSSHGLNPGPSGYGEIRSAQENRRRTDSPSCSVTGTTTSSRSVSPYTHNSGSGELAANGRTIQAFQRYDTHPPPPTNESMTRNQTSFHEDDTRSSPGYTLSHGHGSHPSLTALESSHRSPYAKDRVHGGFRNNGSPYDMDRSLMPQPTEMASPSHMQQASGGGTPQPQVLYMAVPSPDGRGQVLQPVQMVQVPGKPYHFVGSISGQGDANPQQQQMMVLPPLPNQQQPNSAEQYQSPHSVNDSRGSMESRSRVANYAMDNTSRQYSLDTASPTASRGGGGGGGGGDDYSRMGTGTGSQYQVDAAVASLYSAPQRPPLDALLGQVRRLSRDQVGCRLVQQALDEEGPMAATLILNEGLPFWGEAMVDPFGNYLFQKILEKVTPEERVMLVKSVSPRLVNASLNLHGTRSVQKVVELCSQDEQNGYNGNGEESASDILTSSLSPAAARLCIDSHGNHVIQRILLKLSPKHSKFVFDAVAASVGDVARHRHGCCVIQRCLDSPPTEARAHLVHRIVDKALELMQDAYGNYVVQYVLDVCSDEDVHAVCESVVGKVNLLAIQKFSSNVMEKCLERCSDRVKELYLKEMSDPERIRELMMDPFGNYVVQRALSVATHSQAVRLVEAMRPHLIATQTSGPHGQRNGGVRNTAGGRRIIAKICRRFPNFTLSTAGSQDELYSSNKGGHRHHLHHQHHPGPAMAAYAPVGAPVATQHFVGDLRLQAPMPIQQPQPPPTSYYTSPTGSPYFDPQQYNGGRGGYMGM